MRYHVDQMLAPLVRRTWSPRGRTAIFRQSGRWREKVSAIAVLALSPRRHRVRLFFDLYPGANVTGPLLVGFLEALLRELRGPITLIWDRLGVHQSAPVREFLHRHPRLRVEVLPTYAPELNPVEYVWAYSKQNPLGNVAAVSSADLATRARPKLIRIGRRPGGSSSSTVRSSSPYSANARVRGMGVAVITSRCGVLAVVSVLPRASRKRWCTRSRACRPTRSK